MNIFDINKELEDLNNAAFYLDASDPDDAEELERINKSLEALFNEAQGKADWLAKMIHECKFAESNIEVLVKHFTKKKKAASQRLEFFQSLAIDFMTRHNIKETRGDMFSLSCSLSSGSVSIDADLDTEKLPEGLYVTIPAVPDHKKPDIKALQTVLRDAIKDNKGKLDQSTKIVELDGLAGVRLVRAQSLKIK